MQLVVTGRERRAQKRDKICTRIAVMMLAAVAAAAGLVDVAVVGPNSARAASTAASDFTKTGVDQTNPSTATPSSPGAATAGDTIQWVLSYWNKTGSDASVQVSELPPSHRQGPDEAAPGPVERRGALARLAAPRGGG